ncbi:MAG: hypothetical protein R3F23_03250 [Verrucomicrobiia bacterium]
MTLLAVLIIASIVGTIYESNFDAKVARAYIYQAPWFNFWLALLAVNLGAVALSRWPWKKHHTGFLITHLGIIILLVGSIIGRIWGIEGTMTLFKEQPPRNQLLVDERQLHLWEQGSPYQYLFPMEFLNRKPTSERPRKVWTTESGWKIDVIDYSESLSTQWKPKEQGGSLGRPVAKIKLQSAMMGQGLEQWLIANGGEQSIFNLGLATISFQQGDAQTSAPMPSLPNQLIFSYADNGQLHYHLMSRKEGELRGEIKVGAALKTGWADWTVTVEQLLPQAQLEADFVPSSSSKQALPNEVPVLGIKLRAIKADQIMEKWIAFGWKTTLPLEPVPLEITYTWRWEKLPMFAELLDFEVERNEGTDEPASFKSHLRLSGLSEPAEGFCWMNHPANYPNRWWRIWTGLTYKISQASWNPENLNQSTVQILRDPGWLFKWLGSLLICCGIFTMFYLRPLKK